MNKKYIYEPNYRPPPPSGVLAGALPAQITKARSLTGVKQ